MTGTVLTEDSGDGVRIVTLNRPQRLNAINPALLEDLIAAVQEADRDPAIRAIVALASGWRRAPGFAAGILRMANIGIKGVVHSLYWSDLHQQGIHRQIGYDARIDEAAYEASIDHGVEENR